MSQNVVIHPFKSHIYIALRDFIAFFLNSMQQDKHVPTIRKKGNAI